MSKVSKKEKMPEKKFSEMTKEEKRKEIIEWVIWIAVSVAIALLIRGFIFEFAVVNGASMNNTLFDKEYVFVDKLCRIDNSYKTNDILIVNYPGRKEHFVKRLIGQPGDTIAVKDGILVRNGVAVTEPFIRDGFMIDDFEEITVPEGTVFVMGDNRNDSMDSRFASVGPIPYDKITGKAKAVLFPFNAIRGLDTEG